MLSTRPMAWVNERSTALNVYGNNYLRLNHTSNAARVNRPKARRVLLEQVCLLALWSPNFKTSPWSDG